jgi:hypothetical protein
MFMFTQRKALMETNFVAPDMPTCNSPWTGMAPFAAHSLTATHSVSTSVIYTRALLNCISPSSSCPCKLPAAARQDRSCQNTRRFLLSSMPFSNPPREYLLSSPYVKETLLPSLILCAGVQRRRPFQLRRRCLASPMGNATAMRRSSMAT